VGTGGWHWWAQVGGTGGHRWVHCWAQGGGTAGTVGALGTGGGTAGNGSAELVGALLGGTCGCHCWAPDHQGTDHQCPDDRCRSPL
ncbi:unnamed protein product, partial [Staurois parvus]